MEKLRFAPFLLLSFSIIAAAVSTGRDYLLDARQVPTSSGIVEGHVASWPGNTTVYEFLGIPYAQPPLGQLRFAAPQAYNQSNTSSIFLADKYVCHLKHHGKSCMLIDFSLRKIKLCGEPLPKSKLTT